MGTKWLTTMKPSFQTEWLALPPKETHQVLEKIALLTEDPLPDGKVKKHLTHINKKLYRIRAGDYRIFYTFETPYISLLALRRRSEDTYDENFSVEPLGGSDIQLPVDYNDVPPTIEVLIAPVSEDQRALPEPITLELLTNLHISAEYHHLLIAVETESDLVKSSEIVPHTFVEKLLEYMFPRSFDEVIEESDLMVQEVEDLLRFKEGKLTRFLLKLSSEQEKAAQWVMNATGPTQVKGSPGTGKSTVALYRVDSLIQNLLKTGVREPRVLYTTFTNALTKSSTQLLEELLGDRMRYVKVTTADKLITDIVREKHPDILIANESTLRGIIKNVMQQMQHGNDKSLLENIDHLGQDYLLDEICQFIIAREITTLEDYLTTNRTGRKLRLTEGQRRSVWRIYEIFLQRLKRIRRETWQQVRLEAEKIVLGNRIYLPYDAVVVDEAQDLDYSVLRLLVHICKAINRFFITADANQSIYRRDFSWTDIHESLKFTGRRTTVLKTNYRSTRQISEAAQSYLAKSALETEVLQSVHMYKGPLPLVLHAGNDNDEFDLLARILPEKARECNLLTSSCAVLCPTWEKGKTIAEKLKERGISAKFMARQEVDLEYSGVKVMTIHTAKGLEFPVVALAGLRDSIYDQSFDNLEDEDDEIHERNRRTLFVGMTRAMRTLLIIVPAGSNSPLLEGFNEAWNLGG